MTAATLPLTTYARLRDFARISALDDPWEQEVVTQMIDGVSAWLEQYTGRWFLQAARTVEVDVPASGLQVLQLRGAPIDTGETFTLKNDAEWDWAGTTAIDGTTDYHIDATRGRVRFKRTQILESGPGALQVVYTGGLGTTTESLKTVAPGLVQACLLAVNELWVRRRTALRSGSIGKQGFTETSPALEIPKASLQLAAPWRLTNGVG